MRPILSTSPQQGPAELEWAVQPLNESFQANARCPPPCRLAHSRAVHHAYGGGLVGMGYQRDEPLALAARATNEASALVALTHLTKRVLASSGVYVAARRWSRRGGGTPPRTLDYKKNLDLDYKKNLDL